jgi:hypothetical protein
VRGRGSTSGVITGPSRHAWLDVRAATEVLDDRGVSAELVAADASAWIPEGEFDLITSSFALPDRPARTALLRMIRGALAPAGTSAIKDFDSSMSRNGIFAGFDLVGLEELKVAFAGLEIVRAEIVATPVHHHGQSHSDAEEDWTAALLHARKPAVE